MSAARRAGASARPRGGSTCRAGSRSPAGPDGSPLELAGVAVEAVREEWRVEDRWWTPRPAAPPLLRAGPRRRPRRRSSSARAAAGAGTGSGPERDACEQAMPSAPYIELHAHSAFSFLDGASTPAELAVAAGDLGYPAFALTDHDGVWGSMEFAQSPAGTCGVRPITGAELTLEGGAHLTLLVESQAGYRNLCRLLTAAHSHTREGAAAQRRAALGGAGAGRGPRRGARLPLGLRPRRPRWRAPGSAARRRAGRALGRRLLEAFGPERLPGRAAAPLLAPRPRPQPLARPARRAARRALRRDRQRPLPRPAPRRTSRTPSSRSGWGRRWRPPSRAAAATRARCSASPAADGRALRRAPRGGRRDRCASPSGCAST